MGVTRRAVLAVVGANAVTTAVAGCGRGEQPTTAVPMRKVTAVTGFGLLGQDAYLYAATNLGNFREAGLAVTVQAGTGTANNLKLLTAGKADFATVDLSGAVQAYGRGARDWITIAAVYQRSVSCILAMADAGIRTPRDLAGKKIGYQPGGVNHTLFPTYARLSGLDHQAVRWTALNPSVLRAALAAGTVDAITETVIGKAGTEAVTKRPVVALPYSDVLTDLFGNVIVTSRRLYERDPDLVRRFRQAALAGLAYAVEHPDQTGTIFHQKVPAYPANAATAENRLMGPYVRPIGGDPVGSLDPVRVARTIALLKGASAVTNVDVTPEQVVAFDLARPRPATPA